MSERLIPRSKIELLPTEGTRGVQALCKLADDLGYHDTFGQLQYPNGACVGDLLCLLEDNPGAIVALYDWISEEYGTDDEDDVDEDEDEAEGEEK